MLRADYTDDERNKFKELRYSYPDKRVMRRFEILWLHSCGQRVPDIAHIVEQNAYTVREVIHMYQRGGIELVATMGSNRPTSELEKHGESVIAEFKARPPASAKEAAARIEKLTGIKRSPQRVRVFMATIGMKFRKTGAIPAKADLEEQEKFKKKFWKSK